MSKLLELIAEEERDDGRGLLEGVLDWVAEDGWDSPLMEALAILEDDESRDSWPAAANVMYYASSRTSDWPFPAMKAVARLYDCLIEYPGFGGSGLEDAGNLVWSIAKELKGVEYLSDWDPQKDPEVQQYMRNSMVSIQQVKSGAKAPPLN